MLSEVAIILQVQDEKVATSIARLLNLYAETLNTLGRIFPVQELPEIDYLLEEDVNIIGFLPFSSSSCLHRLLDSSGKIKPAPPTMPHSTTDEMLSRIRYLIDEGKMLATSGVGL